jgi:hypothetical protein
MISSDDWNINLFDIHDPVLDVVDCDNPFRTYGDYCCGILQPLRSINTKHRVSHMRIPRYIIVWLYNLASVRKRGTSVFLHLEGRHQSTTLFQKIINQNCILPCCWMKVIQISNNAWVPIIQGTCRKNVFKLFCGVWSTFSFQRSSHSCWKEIIKKERTIMQEFYLWIESN